MFLPASVVASGGRVADGDRGAGEAGARDCAGANRRGDFLGGVAEHPGPIRPRRTVPAWHFFGVRATAENSESRTEQAALCCSVLSAPCSLIRDP